MARTGMLSGTVLLAAWLVGCTPTSEQRDTEFAMQKLERERDALARQVSSEQARNTVLENRLEAEEATWRADRAALGSMRAQVESLRKENERLAALLEERATRPLQRPTVSLSPLPADVDAALQRFAARFPGRVWYNPEQGAVSFANDRLFAPGSDVVRSEATPPLEDLAGLLATVPQEYDIVIVGHTDDTPITSPETLAQHPSNWHLSVHRAIAVQDVLIKAGMSPTHVGVMGYGQHRPIGEDRASNRRVEVFLVRRGTMRSFDPVRPGGT